MQVVSQLEIQLQKERDRLQSMMQHLYLSKQVLPDTISAMQRSPNHAMNEITNNANNISSALPTEPSIVNNLLLENSHNMSHTIQHTQSHSPKSVHSDYQNNRKMITNQYVTHHSVHQFHNSPNSIPMSAPLERSSSVLNSQTGPIRRRITEKSALSLAGGKFHYVCFCCMFNIL